MASRQRCWRSTSLPAALPASMQRCCALRSRRCGPGACRITSRSRCAIAPCSRSRAARTVCRRAAHGTRTAGGRAGRSGQNDRHRFAAEVGQYLYGRSGGAAGGDIVVKRYNLKSVGHALSRLWRRAGPGIRGVKAIGWRSTALRRRRRWRWWRSASVRCVVVPGCLPNIARA